MDFSRSLIMFFLVCFVAQSIEAQKMNGICLVGPFEEKVDIQSILAVKKINADWIAILPEASLDRVSLQLKMNEDDVNWTMDVEGYIDLIAKAKELNFKIFLKPHVVLEKEISSKDKMKLSSSWRGDVDPKKEEDWKIIEDNYESYILMMAEVAERYEVDLFCIGTELKSFVEKRKAFWQSLIVKLKKVYSGEITYSANWDNYQNIPFWSEVDVLGVNCYFPISMENLPSVSKTNKKWDKIENDLEGFADKWNKKLVLTEFGYRNVAFGGREPWTHDKEGAEDALDAVQVNLLRSLVSSLWNKDWVEGGFLWNWNYKALPECNTDFSIRNKPAEQFIESWYLNNQ